MWIILLLLELSVVLIPYYNYNPPQTTLCNLSFSLFLATLFRNFDVWVHIFRNFDSPFFRNFDWYGCQLIFRNFAYAPFEGAQYFLFQKIFCLSPG